jgi:hypothetical protein
MDYKSQFLRVKTIGGMFYSNDRKNHTLIIYAGGAPTNQDTGNMREADEIMKYRCDMFAPDYIGFARSDGTFTPKNCVITFTTLNREFKNGTVGTNYYGHVKKRMKYKRIVFIGKSFGGRYIPLLPKFDNTIKELGIVCPALNTGSYKTRNNEESTEDFMNAMKQNGYIHLYRGITRKEWVRHLQDKDSLAPLSNIKYLERARLFVAHGTEDASINYKNSITYYEKIIRMFPEKTNEVKIRIYENEDHRSVAVPAVKDFMKWLGLKKAQA